MASSLREIEEFSSPQDQFMTQQEAIDELINRQKAASAAGTVSPFESSFNPFNPNFRATAQNAISNMLGGSQISSNPNYLQGRIANSLSGLVDFIPAVGDAVGVGDTITSYRQGDMLGTGINAAATGVGVLPLVGGPASKAVKAGGNRVRSALRGIDAWHGSPHKFDDFSMSRIGTGEGAQAYGHGLYFAEKRGVAKDYRDTLSTKGWDTVTGADHNKVVDDVAKLIGASDDEWLMIDTLLGNSLEFKQSIKDVAIGFGDDYVALAERMSNSTDASKEIATFTNFLNQSDGNLYNVDLKVSPDDLLDWDAPFSEQSKSVQDALSPYMDGPEVFLSNGKSISNPTGKQIYYNVVPNATNQADASKRMQELGVPGIRYLDGGSRSAGEGTRNFVIFDDSLVDTKRVNDKLTDSWMNSEARMARADEMGFNRDIYHKTWGKNFEGNNAFSSFDPQKMQQSDYGYAGKGVYATPKPLQEVYGNVTMPLKTNIKNPYIRTADNFKDELDPYLWIPKNSERLGSNAEASAAWTEMMQSNGYDGFIDEAVENGEIVIFDPKNIRSINAEFDPTKADSSDLLSSISPIQSSLRNIA